MSTIDLIVLGILMQGAKSAYEMVRFIRENQLASVLKISEPAVFKSCRRLAEAGLLDGETIRTSGVPDKVVYAVNASGQARFQELMCHFTREYKPFYLDINAVVWNIENLPGEEGRKLLAGLQVQLSMAKKYIIQHEAEMRDKLPFGPRQIVKQYRMTITALADWIDEAVKEFER